MNLSRYKTLSGGYIVENSIPKVKVSIIMPAYNAEKTLERALNSCIHQSLQEIEVIVIDDCSQDSTPRMLKEIQNKYPDKVRTIFQSENKKQGAARNAGIDRARGEYILFVDSDDWIDVDMCRQLYNAACKEEADMVGSDYFISFDDRDEIKKVSICPDMCGIMDYEKKDKYIKNCGLFWTRLYKREWLERIKLKFPENIFYEDAFFNFYSVLYANKIAHIERPFYHYYQENVSTTRNRNNPHQYERIILTEYILDWSKNKKELEQYRDIIEYKYLHMHGANLIYTCLGFDKPDKKIMADLASQIEKSIPNVYKNMAYKKLPFEFRLYLKLNSISPSLCIFAYKHELYVYPEIIMRKIGRS